MLCFQTEKTYRFNLTLLDERKFKFTYKGLQKCKELFDDAVKILNLKETEYFGIYFIDNENLKQWIDFNRNFQSQFKNCFENHLDTQSIEITVYFGVRFYIADPCKLNGEATRYCFYLQLRKDILENRLPVQFDYAVDLFGYFLQDELGDYNSNRDFPGYASEFNFVPDQTVELENAAEIKHSKLKGMNNSNAETNFLNKAKWLDMYGVVLQTVFDEKNFEHSIGITPTGIAVYQNGQKATSYFWPRIAKLNYKSTKFILTVIDKKDEENSHVFHLASKNQCKILWLNCVEHHRYFRMKTVYEKPAKLKTSLVTSKQTRNTNENSEPILIYRAPTKRRPRVFTEEDKLVNGIGKINLNENYKIQNDNLIFMPSNDEQSNNELISNNNINNNKSNLKPTSPETMSIKSSTSIKYSRKRESASESEFGIRKRPASRNRSRNRRSYVNNENNKENETDSDYQNRLKRPENEERTSRRRSHHRSHSRGSNKVSQKEFQDLGHGNMKVSRSRKSLCNQASNAQLIKNEQKKQTNETSHETSAEENDINEMEKKRQIRRRKRSKSPGGTTRPPEEILQHIKYNLVQPSEEMSADQLKEIPFVKIETKAPAFRISPHQKHKRYSPYKRKSCEVSELPKGNMTYMRDGTAHIVKTKRIIDYGDSSDSKDLITEKAITNIAFSDSGCEDMTNRI